DNCIHATKRILNILNVKNTKKYIEDNIISHPEYPSLLVVSDTLEKYNIETLAIKIDKEKLDSIPLPFIVQVKNHGTSVFFVIKNILENEIEYYDDKNKLVKTSKDDFSKKWTGVCLLAEKNQDSKEVDIEKKVLSSRILKGLKICIVVFTLFWLSINLRNSEANTTLTSISFIGVYTILKIIGLITSGMLLWFDVDQYNPTLQNFCTGGNKKIDCNSVLTSKHSKILNGFLSLSELSFSYFFGTLFFLIISAFSYSSLSISSLLSFTAIPIIIISIYYQAVIIKQWCKFCIITQAVLVSEILISFFGELYKSSLQLETLPIFLVLLLIPILVWKQIKPLLEQEKETNLHKRALKKIKNNPNVLEGLLLKSKKIETPTKGLGISITNKTAKYNVVKVCNPYCGPCAKAHPILEDLVHKGIINLQVLFTAKADEKDKKFKPVAHFLEIDEQGNKTKTQQALDDWYSANKKEYDLFANKHPIKTELIKQKEKIKAMNSWCTIENITATPTIFINGNQLPKEYKIEDLTEVLQ
ncbi:cysteine peptidase family C39 domain-containing protein, partial [Polaribacter reichenbachii]